VPAAAVIPAPVAYTNIVAVKKLVVRCRVEAVGQLLKSKAEKTWTSFRFSDALKEIQLSCRICPQTLSSGMSWPRLIHLRPRWEYTQ